MLDPVFRENHNDSMKTEVSEDNGESWDGLFEYVLQLEKFVQGVGGGESMAELTITSPFLRHPM